MQRKMILQFRKSENHYSTDQNLWDRSVECGALEDSWIELPKERIYGWTISSEGAPDEPTYLEIYLENGNLSSSF
jgi:argininosuccinate synthase